MHASSWCVASLALMLFKGLNFALRAVLTFLRPMNGEPMLFTPPIVSLFVPGDRPDRYGKAVASGADAVIIDLEDAVAEDRKVFARESIEAYRAPEIPLIVRINGVDSPFFSADLALLAKRPVDTIMLPKASSASEIAQCVAALGEGVNIIPIIESAIGLIKLPEILGAPGVVAATFGPLDLALDLGCLPQWDALAYARSQLVLYSRLAGLPAPLDGVTMSLTDEEVVWEESQRAAAHGFGGKLAVHPRQIPPILRAFMPDEARYAWAKRVIEATRTEATIKVDGQMIDRPQIIRAQRIVQLVESQGTVQKG